MGALLGCGAHCEDCSSWRCGQDHCSSICLSHRLHQQPPCNSNNNNAGVAARRSGWEALPPKPERYTVAGGECPIVQSVCGDFIFSTFAGGDDSPFEDEGAARDGSQGGQGQGQGGRGLLLREDSAAQGGEDFSEPNLGTVNLGERLSMEALVEECRFNPGKVQKIRQLAKDYCLWRPVRGDGNCYYRTVSFGILESFVSAKAEKRLKQITDLLADLRYESAAEQKAHELLMQSLCSWDRLHQLEHWVMHDMTLDQALVRAARRLVRMFLTARADELSPSGLTYTELVRALDPAYADVEDFCAQVVDPMGRDVETLALDALPLQLGVGLRMWLLDRRDGVDLVKLDTPGPNGDVDVHVLFKPGHYDLLYPKPFQAEFVEDMQAGRRAASCL